MSDDWITTADASKLSGYHPERIRELVREGKIFARKWGSALQISRESLLDYLNNAIESDDRRFGPKRRFPKTNI